jgi:hypothetical protein
MVALKIFYLFILYENMFCNKNNDIINDTKKNTEYLHSLNLIQNIPVENNVPIIAQNTDNQNIETPELINSNPIPIISPEGIEKIKIITNTSIKINTTKMDKMCTPECCMGCRVQFEKLNLQKNCITTICKCQIIEENLNETRKRDNKIKDDKTNLLLMSNNKNDKIKFSEIENNNFPLLYYSTILFIFLIYEIYILYGFKNKENEFGFYNDIDKDIMKKEKEKRLNKYLDLVNDDEELTEFLI